MYGNTRVIYNTGFRDKGSPYHGGSGDIAATTPADEPLLGTMTACSPRPATAVRSRPPSAASSRPGTGSNWASPTSTPTTCGSTSTATCSAKSWRTSNSPATTTPDAGSLSADEGDLYKIAVWFEFSDDNRNFQATGATIQRFTTTPNDSYKLARYRWNWQRRSNDGDASNYAQLFDLVTAVNDTSSSLREPRAEPRRHGAVDARVLLRLRHGQLGRLDLQRRPEHVPLSSPRASAGC